MCNEFCQGWELEQCLELAARCGYEGLELAPFTIAPSVTEIDAAQRQEIRQAAARHGLDIVGLHWLLVSPEGLHTNHPDADIRRRTREYFEALVHFCGDVGGDRMVIGSPKQRSVLDGETYEDTFARTVELYQAIAPLAAERGVMLAMEPLARTETNFLTSMAETRTLVEAVDHPSFRLILDCKAMSDEDRPIPDIIREAGEYLVHFHANDPNLRYPGAGDLDFHPILAALDEIEYDGWVSIEVFDFNDSPEEIAGEGLRYLKECLP